MSNDLIAGSDLSARRQPCEVYSRVVGYLRPVVQWNKGKKAEFYDRREYDRQLQEAVN